MSHHTRSATRMAAAALLVTVGAGATLFWLKPYRVRPPKTATAEATINAFHRRLQAEATQACLCSRRNSSNAQRCWTAYRTLIANRAITKGGDACAPIVPLQDCIGKGDQSVCVTTAYKFGDRTLCTSEEAEQVAGAWQASVRAHQGAQKAIEAGNSVADALIAGRRADAPKITVCG